MHLGSCFNTSKRTDDTANRQSLLAFNVCFCIGCHRNSKRVLTPEKHPFTLAILVNYSTLYYNTQRALQKQFDIRDGKPRGAVYEVKLYSFKVESKHTH